jgi:hypothetical protein
MKKILSISISFFLVFPLLFTGCSTGTDEGLFLVTVKNSSDLDFADLLVEADLTVLDNTLPDSLLDRLVANSGEDHPWQLADVNRDGQPDELLILTHLAAGESKKISVLPGAEPAQFRQRAQAEISVKTGGAWEDRVYQGGSFKNVKYLRVPDEHTDHSFYIRYEGPGWESDRIGYRFYLDWRNAVDIFGKMTDEMVLQDVGQDGFDSYHEPADWGMDILKVGESLGLGSVGIWAADGKAKRVEETDSITCHIVSSGPIQAEVETNYYGWQAGEVKTNLRSILTISAGSRLTHHQLTTSAELDNLCTGIVIHDLAEFSLLEPEDTQWMCLYSYGKQSLAEDNLGMAVLFRSDDMMEITGDDHSKVVVLDPSGGELEYYYLAAWEKEPAGIRDAGEFRSYLEHVLARLNNPPKVTLTP